MEDRVRDSAFREMAQEELKGDLTAARDLVEDALGFAFVDDHVVPEGADGEWRDA